MKLPKPEIGRPLKLNIYWYDRVPEPERNQTYEGEVIGWRQSQVLVRVKDYAVVRFWKQSGLEVGNRDGERRGFRLDVSELNQPIKVLAPPISLPDEAA